MTDETESKFSWMMDNLVFLVLLLVFGLSLFYWVSSQRDGASIYADHYAKETTRFVDFSKPGDVISLDIHKVTEIAQENGVNLKSDIFSVDNAENEVCYKLSQGRKTCYHFFNDVDVVDWEIEFGKPINILTFRIEETHKTDEDIIGGQNELA